MSTDDLIEAFASKIQGRGVPVRAEDNRSRFAEFEGKLAKRLPESFAGFLSRYTFPSFDVLGVSLFGWQSDSNPYIEEATAPKGSLSEVLHPRGFVQIGRPDTGNFDAVCFDLNQKTHNREYPIVRIDHEEVLCNWRVRVVGQLWPSFVKFMEAVVADLSSEVWNRPIH